MIKLSELNEITKNIIFKISSSNTSVVILDMSFHLHRYAYAHKNLSINKDGVNIPTGHIYGFTKLITTLKKRFANTAIIIAVDGYDQDRKNLDGNYKAGRETKEFNIHAYTTQILEMCSLIPDVYVTYNSKYEADDSIYIVSRSLDTLFKKNWIEKDIYIYSSDKDLYQAVNDKIKVVKKFGTGKYWLSKAEIVNIEVVKEEFNGVSPDNLAVFRSIVGDTSDNLKGYFRFPKKVAGIIAENCSVEEYGLFIGDDSVLATDNVRKYLDIINTDYGVFKKNLAIMKLKEFNFELSVYDTSNAFKYIEYYQLNAYKNDLEGFGITL
jgi:hypothetical protein